LYNDVANDLGLHVIIVSKGFIFGSILVAAFQLMRLRVGVAGQTHVTYGPSRTIPNRAHALVISPARNSERRLGDFS
jgi:hypothetical protein